MAQLPPDGQYLIQQADGHVRLFERYTERELASFDPADQNATAIAQGVIHGLGELTEEQKSFAHFWSGYFYAHAGMPDPGDRPARPGAQSRRAGLRDKRRSRCTSKSGLA